ncbi:MAG: HlyD family efflux transporter periplasmic adaptor subunit, partial [Syntrophales bacterium LBB04]|nr:HlyD family efflux transporter periplasmic adaptor subunit [Syntrophales bacterium LBB04]
MPLLIGLNMRVSLVLSLFAKSKPTSQIPFAGPLVESYDLQELHGPFHVTKSAPAGTVKLSLTSLALSGPPFVTVTRHFSSWFTFRVAGHEIVAPRSACGRMLKKRSMSAKGPRSAVAICEAHLDLKRTVVVAPISGRIARKNVDPGKYVQPGQPLLSIVKEDTWIIANFKETQIEKMA